MMRTLVIETRAGQLFGKDASHIAASRRIGLNPALYRGQRSMIELPRRGCAIASPAITAAASISMA